MLVIVALVGTAYYFYGIDATRPSAENSRIPRIAVKPSISLNEYLDNKLYARHSNATWISNTELMYSDSAVSHQ